MISDSGAFKTLDKDNNGTIKVNVQEVKWSVVLHRVGFHWSSDFKQHKVIFSPYFFSVAPVDHVLLSLDKVSPAHYTEPLCPHYVKKKKISIIP